MAYETFQTIVGTALVDSRFRSDLLLKSPEVLHDLHLTPRESKVITSIHADTLQSFAGELDRWISLDSSRR